MTGELVNRIAQRMRATSGGQPFSWENAAREALRELLQPTEGMVEAGTQGDPDYDEDVRRIFRAMIQSELDE